MTFSPDIVVTGKDSPRILLVVEAKYYPTIRKEDESKLKSYMLDMKCPVGLIVTPELIEVFRDRYIAHSESSVEHVASFPAPKNWDIFKMPHHGAKEKEANDTRPEYRFEEAVKFWLETLAESPSIYLKEFDKNSRDALSNYVVPALAEGIVRSGGPRESVKSR